MEYIQILGVKIAATNLDGALNYLTEYIEKAKGNYICVSNVHTTVMAKEKEPYRRIQNQAFLTLPDGKPLSIIGKICGHTKINRITGPDFMEKILHCSKENNWRHYFYGNTEENLEILIGYLNHEYPNLNIAGYEPSVFRELEVAEKNALVDRINLSDSDFVWVGLGAPRQEILCSELCIKSTAIWVGVGGAFNVIPGIIPRAPMWMQKCCLEWFYRWLKEPRRLFKRYFVTNIKFLLYILKDKLHRI